MSTIYAELTAEAWREFKMRLQVYPGRVQAGKMTQRTAEKKIQLMKEIAIVMHVTVLLRGIPKLPIYEPDGDPTPIPDLTQHIKEAETEIKWREHRIKTHVLNNKQKQEAETQLQLMKDILQILETIQNESGPQQEQLSLF